MTGRAAPLANRQIRMPEAVAQWLGVAQRNLDANRADLAVEHLAGAAVVDIQQHHQTFLASAFEAAFLADLYAKAFDISGLRTSPRPGPTHRFPSTNPRPLRILYVIGSLVQGQAASANVVRLIKSHHRDQFDPALLVVEEMTARTPPLTALKFPNAPSQSIGRDLIQQINATLLAPSRVQFLSTDGTYLDAARTAIDHARALAPDLAIFIASPASPIQAAMAYASVAPVQLNMCIGVPLPIRGIDAIIYNNPRRQRDDEPWLQHRSIRVMGVETSGGDAASGGTVVPASRASIGVPDDAVVFASAANALPPRMLRASFAADLARFLVRHPTAWWVAIGGGDFAPVLNAMRVAASQLAGSAASDDVIRRARLLGPMQDIRPTIKACDILLNEYPEGGGNVVIEAMGCGVPVVAMAAGSRHAECIGAQLVGPPYAIEPQSRTAPGNAPTTDAYWALAENWLYDATARRSAGRAMQRRAIERLDYTAIVRAYEACYNQACASTRLAMAA